MSIFIRRPVQFSMFRLHCNEAEVAYAHEKKTPSDFLLPNEQLIGRLQWASINASKRPDVQKIEVDARCFQYKSLFRFTYFYRSCCGIRMCKWLGSLSSFISWVACHQLCTRMYNCIFVLFFYGSRFH